MLDAKLDRRAYVPAGILPVVELEPQVATPLNPPSHRLTDHIRRTDNFIADVANAVATCRSGQD